MPVKGNQPGLHATIAQLFARSEQAAARRQATEEDCLGGLGVLQVLGDEQGCPEISSFQSSGVEHGRIEQRRVSVLSLPPQERGRVDWPGWAQVMRVERRTKHKRTGKLRYELVYGITSMEPEEADAASLAKCIRQHWTIENKSHWVRDVTFAEDHGTVRTGAIPQVMAALRNTTITVLRVAGHTNIAKACRYFAANPAEALGLLGAHM